ncbi:MAG: zinc-dependent alcohol dehydrogenase family protein [Candidatus Thorarchaeota archaeon]
MQMKAAIFEKPNLINVCEKKIPRLGVNELLIEINYCGICGTDVHIYEGQVPFVKYPIIGGHEFSGRVVDIGSKVHNLSSGDRISVNPNLSCKDKIIKQEDFCYYCKKDRPHFCTNWEALGVTTNGGFAEYVVCPSTAAVKIPKPVSSQKALFMEPIACCIHGLNCLKIQNSDVVLILGAGPIGLLMLSLIKSIYSSTVIVSEPNSSRRNLASNLGADVVIDPIKRSLSNIVYDKTEKRGVDISIEAVGSSKTATEAIELLNKGGQSLIFGVSPAEESITLRMFEIYNKEISLFGSFTNPHENQEAMKLLQNDVIDPSKLISHEFSIEELEKGILLLKNLEEDVSKIIIVNDKF